MSNGDDDQWPECDPEYIKALGRAVYNFAVLEISVVWIIERFEPGYFQKYTSKKRTAGTVAQDFANVIARAQGHGAAAELSDINKKFADLKNKRDKLLHANPALFVIDGQASHGLHYQAHDLWWDKLAVHQAAADFAAAAEEANRLLKNLVLNS